MNAMYLKSKIKGMLQMSIKKKVAWTAVGLFALAGFTNMLPHQQEEKFEKPVVEVIEKVEPKKEQPKQVDRLTKENFEKIDVGSFTGEGGMSVDQVKEILGEPSHGTKSEPGGYKVESLQFASFKEGKSITVIFTNGGASEKYYDVTGGKLNE